MVKNSWFICTSEKAPNKTTTKLDCPSLPGVVGGGVEMFLTKAIRLSSFVSSVSIATVQTIILSQCIGVWLALTPELDLASHTAIRTSKCAPKQAANNKRILLKNSGQNFMRLNSLNFVDFWP